MRRAVSSLVFVLCLFLCLSCSGREETGSVSKSSMDEDELTAISPPESLEDKFAYVFGYKLSQALSQGVENADPLYITLGTYDAAHGTRLYTDEEMEAFEAFMENNHCAEYIEAHPDYTKENIQAFAEEHKESGVPEDILILLIRNEYIYAMDYDERPVADIWFDQYITKALEVFGE